MNTKDKGSLVEAKIMTKFLTMGYKVSLPWGENSSYDMVVDTGDALLRVQCKKSRMVNGSLCFNIGSVQYTKEKKKHTKISCKHDKIDAFATYCDETAGYYLIPVVDLLECKHECRLRHDPLPPLHKEREVKWSRDYEI